jgi:hypothetical protein
MRLQRFGITLGITLLALAAPRAGQGKTPAGKPASKDARACAAAYKDAQVLEHAGHLQRARAALVICARSTCGDFIRHACTVRHGQLDAEMPSIVPLASDAAGAPVVDVQVAMDGQPLTSRLDGRAIAVDPGLHEFTFRLPQGKVVTETLVIAQGQRNRALVIAPPEAAAPRAPDREALPAAASVAPAPAARPIARVTAPPSEILTAAPALPSEHSLVAPVLFGLVGAAGLGGYGVLTFWGRRDNDRLGQCAPDCAPASVEHIRRLYLAADVSLGVGLVTLATTTWLALRPEPTRERAARSTFARTQLELRPTSSGAWAAIAGRF